MWPQLHFERNVYHFESEVNTKSKAAKNKYTLPENEEYMI